DLGSTGTSRIDEISIEGRLLGNRLPFASSPVITSENDDHFADIFIQTTGTAQIDTSFLQCDRVDADSTFSISFAPEVRHYTRLQLPKLSRPSNWHCMIVLRSDVGEFISDISEIIVEPPPPPFAEKPELHASEIKLL